MKTKALIIFSALFLGALSSSQAQKSVWFSGLGRASIQNDEFIDTTSTQEGKAAGGYTLFDLGVNAQSGKNLRAHVILRLRNEFGGFFGDGSTFEFRQMRLEGLIGNIVKYEIGDLDVKLTPYTIHNFEEMYTDYESELFGIKRDVIAYENFYTDDNTWRMQGVNSFTTLKFNSKVADELFIRGFGNRIAASDQLSTPDRWLFGTNLKLKQSKFFEIGLNVVNVSDIAGTLTNASTYDYDNLVVTTDFKATYETDKLMFNLLGELGFSDYTITESANDTSSQKDDYFYDLKLKAKYKPLNIGLTVGYRNVGAYYNSPSAQSRRIDAAGTPAVFSTYLNGNARGMTVFDRYSQEVGLYSNAISTTLRGYLPRYNLVSPYGAATPNRQGLTATVSYEHPKKLVKADYTFESVSEVIAEGTAGGDEAKRDYLSLRGGVSANVGKIIGWENDIILQGGFRQESSKREANFVNFSNTAINAGLDIEAVSKLHLLVGYKSLSAAGNEYISERDQFNEVISTPSTINIDIQENVLALGAKYNFSKNAFFSIQGHLVDYKDNTNADVEYDLNQLYFIYQLKF